MDVKEHQDSMSRQYRQVAGLPEREGDSPEYDPLEPKELRRYAEPEGGYGGEGEEEVDERAGLVDEELVEELQEGEERSAKSGQGVNDGSDASTSTPATEEQMEAAGGDGGKQGTKESSSKEKTPAASKSGAAKKTAKKS